MNRRLLVDVQLLQSPAWDRGMGKYSLGLLAAVSKIAPNEGWSDIEVLLSKRAKSPKGLIDLLKKKLAGTKVTYLDLMPNEIGNEVIAKHNRQIINQYVEPMSSNDTIIDFFILSPMQGEIYSTLPTVDKVNKIVLFHDLIPLMFHKMYLQNPITRVEYLSKINELLKADVYVVNSRTSSNDLAVYLGIDTGRINSIDGGPAEHAEKPKPIEIPQPFILMPTGNDLRKNNERAIRGFEIFNQRHDNKYKLVITSYFKDYQIAQLTSLSDNVIFTGNVTGANMSYLYEKTEALLFPPEYEGLGMPIIEALEHGARVACSNISVFREISGSAFTFFDPYSVDEIAAALGAVTEQPKPAAKLYKNILSRYSWERTAEKFMSALAQLTPSAYLGNRPKIAIFTPSPAGPSRAGKFAQESHAEMSRFFDCQYYIESANSPEKRINYLPYISASSEIRPGLGFNEAKYDDILYQLDNSPDCAAVIINALAQPGIVVLHDSELTEAWQTMVDYNLIDKGRFELEIRIANELGQSKPNYLASVLARQKTVIVFNEDTEKAVRHIAAQINPQLKILKLDPPVNALVYDDVLPKKTVAVTSSADTLFADPSITDFHSNGELAKTKLLIVESQKDYRLMVEAMRYGVVPCLKASIAKKLNLPKGVGLQIAEGQDSYQAAQALASDEANYQEYSRRVKDYIKAHYNFRQYAGNFDQLLKGSILTSPNSKEAICE